MDDLSTRRQLAAARAALRTTQDDHDRIKAMTEHAIITQAGGPKQLGTNSRTATERYASRWKLIRRIWASGTRYASGRPKSSACKPTLTMRSTCAAASTARASTA